MRGRRRDRREAVGRGGRSEGVGAQGEGWKARGSDRIDMMKRDAWKGLLGAAGADVGPGAMSALRKHIELVREWNHVVSLVSRRDVGKLFEAHVIDSLSLAPILVELGAGRGKRLLDIGSGGGFPGIPLKIVLPELALVLVERSERKVGFLRRAVGMLGLQGVDVLWGQFPAEWRTADRADFVTARAVERPQRVGKAILKLVKAGAVFLCQSGDPTSWVGEGFHVEHVEDDWSRAGFRRGPLHLIRAETPS